MNGKSLQELLDEANEENQKDQDGKSLEQLVDEGELDEFFNHDGAYDRYLKNKNNS